MRQIKFRGKRLDNGEWVYGFVVFNRDGKAYIKDTDYNVNNGRIDIIPDEVDPATVGEFSGLLDKNGKEIYEGDIVLHKRAEQGKENSSYNVKEVVRCYLGCFEIGSGKLYQYQHENGLINGKLTKRNWKAFGSRAGSDIYMVDFDIEIIGNIHENPELLA